LLILVKESKILRNKVLTQSLKNLIIGSTETIIQKQMLWFGREQLFILHLEFV